MEEEEIKAEARLANALMWFPRILKIFCFKKKKIYNFIVCALGQPSDGAIDHNWSRTNELIDQ